MLTDVGAPVRSGQLPEVVRIARWALAALLVLVIAAGGALTWVARRSLPVTTGQVTVASPGPGLTAGVAAPVKVYHDAYGVPTASAKVWGMPSSPRVTSKPRTASGRWTAHGAPYTAVWRRSSAEAT